VNEANVQQAVPFFRVTDMEASLRFYVQGVGFEITNKWIVEGSIRWCWLQLGGAALMLQEFHLRQPPVDVLGAGVSVSFMCRDAIAIYHALKSRGLNASKPFVGNGLWVTGVRDPDGYFIEFQSPTDVPEETEYSEP
jgi:catechol 2,3-dioxygenase-like lactoylglutathione lyase family enzyme